ncbi:hypothetical protein [Idiomarina xiamenensis]|uniref:Phage protein n=1 Tax=Idiomarina xiamenensis 10-D-4 TaxID=740709 RepID=K2JYR5_9GAMM|nr:hypothetical protein [Idiomarina xiamenensis]EKE79727.1 phage protein [Idiomarina xiamenensis 10-D-4]
MIVQFPDLPVSKSGFQIVTATELLFSPYNKVEEVWEEPGDKWRCTLAFNFLTRAEFRLLDAHLASLRGHVGVTTIRDYAHENAVLNSSTLICDVDGEHGTSISVFGAGSSQPVAAAGDRCQVGNQLFKITQDSTSDGTGRAVLHVQPEIRKPLTVGTPVITQQPRGAFRIENPSSLPTWSGNKSYVRGVQIDFIEALNV